MECLDDNAVSEFVSGALPPSLLVRVEGHLASCRDCRALVAALAQDAAADSSIETVRREKLSASQVAELPRRALTVGDRVGRYLVLSTLGAGGMGVVFAAYDPHLDRKVALKLLRSGTKLDVADAQKRLRREAQAIAQLSHPNVVGVYDVGTTDDGDLYIAMEFVEGDTLTRWLERWPRTWREIVDVFVQAGRGLAAAHSVGLLHRDFKPDNVLVGGDGRVRVTDFGLARSLVARLVDDPGRGASLPVSSALAASLTATGTVLGTPRYMAPEQFVSPSQGGADIDARADQFSFCVALYEALYGTHPLPGGTSISMLENGDRALPPPEGARVPPQIARAVIRGLDRDRTKRFPTMAALMAELVPPAPAVTPRVVALGIGAVLLASAAAAAVVMGQDASPPPGPPDDLGVQPFVDEINILKRRIRELDEDRKKLLEALDERNRIDVGDLRRQLEAKDKQIQELVKKVDELARTPVARPAAARPPSQTFRVVDAMFEAASSFEPCFIEWGERRDDLGNPHVEANLVLRLTVNPDGVAHSAAAVGESSPSLRLCVELAAGRIAFPTGPEQLDLEVHVGWSQGMLNVSPRVVGRREAPRSDLDLR